MRAPTTIQSRTRTIGALLALTLANAAYADDDTPARERSLVVTATAYNSLPSQTSGSPDIAAWGDRLKPGMKTIAVSRDLLRSGLGRGTRVRISGLRGEYTVLDKMAKRWRRRIDIYMGVDVEAALEWGKRKVTITWQGDDYAPIAPVATRAAGED